MYDSRIGRRWERDPLVKEWESPYAAFANNPILFADPLGLSALDKIKMLWNEAKGTYEEKERTKVTDHGDYVDVLNYEGGAKDGVNEVTTKGGNILFSNGGSSNNFSNALQRAPSLPKDLPKSNPTTAPTNNNTPRGAPVVAVNPVVGVAAVATSLLFTADDPRTLKRERRNQENANRKDNPETHIVYEMFGKDSKSGEQIILKYGISNYDRYKEQRPKSQKMPLTVYHAGKVIEIHYNIVKFTHGRAAALSAEKDAVTDFYKNNPGKILPNQTRPVPWADAFEP